MANQQQYQSFETRYDFNPILNPCGKRKRIICDLDVEVIVPIKWQ